MGTTSSRMSTKRKRTDQSTSRSGAAREPPQQQLPDDIEKENAAVLDKLPREVWEKIMDSLRVKWDGRRIDHFPFAMTCRYFRDLHQKAVAAAAAAATDWTSIRWTTELKTLLASYSCIEDEETNPYEVFPPRINECKYPLLPLILLCLLLLTLYLAQSMKA